MTGRPGRTRAVRRVLPAVPSGLSSLPGGPAALRIALRTTPVLRQGLPLTALLALVAGSARIIAPLALQQAVDSGLDPAVVRQAVLVGAAATATAGLASWWLNLRIRHRVETAIADLVARLAADLDAMTTFLNGGGVQFVTNLAQLLIAGIVLTVHSWQLALPVFAIAAGLLAVMTALQQVIRHRFDRVRAELARLQGSVLDAVTGAAVIRSTGTAGRTRRLLDDAVDRTRDSFLRAQLPLHLNTSLGEIGITAMTLAVLVGGVWWSTTAAARLTAGGLVAMIVLITFFVRPLQFLVQSLGEAQNALTGWRRALELVTTPSARVIRGRALPPGPVGIRFDRVEAAYGDGPPVLQAINVTVPPGQSVAVVGRTGSGKSTFAKLLTRRLRPRAGNIRLSGVPLADLSDESLAGRVVVVPQDPMLFDLSIADNIALGSPGATRREVAAALDRLGLTEWATALPHGIDTPAGPRGERLSVGERQLVALARTALADPDLVVLDEATSGVDPGTEAAVHRTLARLMRGRTTLSIAHRLSTAASADRVLVFAAGRIVQDGRPADLLATGGPYAAMFAHRPTPEPDHPTPEGTP